MRHQHAILGMVAVLMLALLPQAVFAQNGFTPCPDARAYARRFPDRFIWDRYNVNPLAPKELERSSIGLVRGIVGTGIESGVSEREKYLLLQTQTAVRTAIARVLFNEANPDFSNPAAPYNRFWEKFVSKVEDGEGVGWTDSSSDPSLADAFACGSTKLDLPEAFGTRVVNGRLRITATRPPVVAFQPQPEAWVINPIPVEGGINDGKWVRIVIFKGCFNVSGFFVPAPPPPLVAPPAPVLTLVKEVINDNGGTAQVSNFPLFVGDREVTSGVAVTLQPGTYTVSERSSAGYRSSAWSGDCDASGNVTLSAGERKICRITNNDVAPPPPPPPVFSFQVHKQWLDRKGRELAVKDWPKGWQNVSFVATDATGNVIGTVRPNNNSDVLFLNVVALSGLRVSEDPKTLPKGWLDKSGTLLVNLEPDRRLQTEFAYGGWNYVNQRRSGSFCGNWAWRCWVPPLAAGITWWAWPRGEASVIEREKIKGGGPGPSNPGGSP
ncbi:MAG TPA: hypothetical protein VGQ87_00420 [Patescibacteria group bacterium]|jgi:hypothetical protein|nr:hypothetical protein [Patescibacteria group bacterium]